MSAPDLAAEAAKAGNFPSTRFNQRERKLLESVKAYVDAASGAGSVVLADLAPGIAPSHVVKFAGVTSALSSSSNAITVTGVAATDIVVASFRTLGGATSLVAVPTTNTITITLGGSPSGTVVSYLVLRAAS